MPIVGFKKTYKKGNSIQGGGFFGVFASQSMQGGGFFGSFASQSIQGGGSVSSVNAGCCRANTGPGTFVGFFVKVASLPGGDTTLVDFNGASVFYFRCKLTSAGHVVLEASYRASGAISVDLTPTTPISTGTWYFVSIGIAGHLSGSDTGAGGIVTGPGGISADGFKQNFGVQGGNSLGTSDANIACTLGWGVSESTGYSNFLNSSGNELSKLEVRHPTSGAAVDSVSDLLTVPTSDVSTSGLEALYLCRDTLGSSTCNDSTVNAFNMSPGPNGLTVVTDGPYP